jgi:AcrR family transcriptional regulator
VVTRSLTEGGIGDVMLGMETKKRVRDGAGTKDKVLKAATDLFSKLGFNGTSLIRISEQSGASVGLILHHFKTKRKLYDEVRKASAGHLMAQLGQLFQNMEPGLSLANTLKELVRLTLSFFKENPSALKLNSWAYLEGAKANEAEAIIFTEIHKAIKAGQESGVLRKDIDTYVMMCMVRGATDFWLLKGETMKQVLGLDENRELDDVLVDQLFQTFVP